MNRTARSCSIWEACFWTFCYPFAQGIVLVLFLVALVIACYGEKLPSSEEVIQLALEMNLDRSFLLIGVASLGALFLVIPLLRLRLGRDFRKIVGWRTPRHEEVIFALATVIPIAVLGDLLYEFLQKLNVAAILQILPETGVQQSTLSYLQSTLVGVPYPILIVALALGPAVGEELIFRGIIGRGLVSRYGAWTGSVITALLFALAHMTPTHALATLPIAFLLQFLYLKTGTIWIPILVHFCNNLLAVTMMRFNFAVEVPVSPLIAVVFILYLTALLVTFESRRRNWVTA